MLPGRWPSRRGGLPRLPGGLVCRQGFSPLLPRFCPRRASAALRARLRLRVACPRASGSRALSLPYGPRRGAVPAAAPGTRPRPRRPARPRARTAGHRPGHDRSGRRPAGSSCPTGRRGPRPALPAIFRGIDLDPLAAGNISYLLWMIMGYRLVQAVLVVTVGRLGDMFGRVRIYNVSPHRLVGQHHLRRRPERGAGRRHLRHPALRRAHHGLDEPVGAWRPDRRRSPVAAFAVLETRIAEPMFQLSLFRIRAFTAGNLAGLAVAHCPGGLQFMLIIWLQGSWLPLHGYDYSQTPLWAGIFLLPATTVARRIASCAPLRRRTGPASGPRVPHPDPAPGSGRPYPARWRHRQRAAVRTR